MHFVISCVYIQTIRLMALVRLAGRYRLREEIASGLSRMYGALAPSHFTHRPGYTDEIYLARDILSGNDIVLKLERVDGNIHSLSNEFDIYRKLKGGIGIPRVHWFGTEAGFDAMAVDRLGLSLEDLFIKCHFTFTIKTVLLLAGQLVSKFDF
jgi:hypothetical protein